MRIRHKLLIFLVLPLIALLAVQFIFTAHFARESINLQNHIIFHTLEEMKHADELAFITARMGELTEESLLDLLNDDIDDARETIREILDLRAERREHILALRELASNAAETTEVRSLSDLEDYLHTLETQENVLFGRIDTATHEEGHELLQLSEQMEPLEETIFSTLERYNEERLAETEEAQEALLDLQETAFRSSLGAAITGLVVFASIIILISRHFVAPIERLRATVGEITAGNLDAEVHDKERHDEIGNLARNFEAMLTNFRGIVREKINKKFKK